MTRYGPKPPELRPPPEIPGLSHRDEPIHPTDIECPTCGVDPGVRCELYGFLHHELDVHPDRIRLAEIETSNRDRKLDPTPPTPRSEATWRELLDDYGDHTRDCPKRDGGGSYECTCGWDALRKELER